MSPRAQRAEQGGRPCSTAGSSAAKSPPATAGERDQDRQVEEETMAELMGGATAHLETPPPSDTPSPPTGLGCAFRQETAAAIPTAPVTEQPMRRAEVQETPRGEAAAAAVEGGSIAAATAPVEAVEDVAAAAEAPAEAAVDQEPSEAVALSASPAPVMAAVLAAAVTAGSLADAPVEGEVLVAAVSARTSAATEGADTQKYYQAASGRRGHGTGAPGRAACGRGGRKFRAQPAPRRPGAGLGPGAPGPLQGWSVQEQSPLSQERQPPSVEPERGGSNKEADVRHVAGHIAPEAATTQGTEQETRSSTHAQGITWGRLRMGLARQTQSPWIPAGRAPQAGRGGGTMRGGPGKERQFVGPEAEDAGQEVEEGAGAQSSAEGRRL
ncbi:unnamed protein product [Closterium sp. NIES-65]|nr:unnamed protein product [Closterium sp. NIES-65]